MRIGQDIIAERDKLDRLAGGFRMAGEDELARKATFAAQALTAALNALTIYHQAAAQAASTQEPQP